MKATIVILLIIMVTGIAAADGTATLSWTAPTTNVDGTPLTDLGGYKVYWSDTSGTYTQVNSIDVGNVLTYTIILPEGLKFFVATAYDTSGNESDWSNEVSKNIVDDIKPLCPCPLTVE